MKKAIFCLMLFFIYNGVYGQSSPLVIKNFLSTLQKNTWTLKELKENYLIVSSTEQRAKIDDKGRAEIDELCLRSLNGISEELKKKSIDIDKLSYFRYDNATEELKTMAIDESIEKDVYIVTNDSGFKHYFFLKDNRIASWMTFKNNKAFLSLPF
jgi:hypothetical protein